MSNNATRGFTLIEIMVALTVFSLAAMALLRLQGATLRSVTTLDDAVTARLVARNVAIVAATDAQAPAPGRTIGSEVNGGRNWTWVRTITPTGNAQVVRIDVAVRGASGLPGARLTMVRPPYMAAL